MEGSRRGCEAAEGDGRQQKAVGAEGSRQELMKKADSARRRGKGRGSEMSKSPTLRVYKEGGPPSN